MNDALINPRATVGGNNPPLKEFFEEQNQQLTPWLETDNADLLARTAELLSAFERAPESINDQDTAGKMADFIAQITKCVKAAESKRVDIKAGPLAAGRIIDSFYSNKIIDLLDTPKGAGRGIKQRLLARLTAWEQVKAAEERKRREEAEAEARRLEAEARRVAEEQRRQAEAAAAAIKNEKDMAAALQREVEARAAAERAEKARQEAAAAAAAAAAKAADMHTTRGDYGSSSSLRTQWKARIIGTGPLGPRVDLNALYDFISRAEVERAANAYAKIHKGSKPIAGIEFYEETQAVVRG